MNPDSPPPPTPGSNDGIYVLRTTQQNQVQLNLLADQKANIIIGVSLIFFTIAQRQLLEGIGGRPLLTVPLAMLAVTMLASFVLAIFVLVPRMRKVSPCKPSELSSPLFFGSFEAVGEDEFTDFLLDEVSEPISSRELLIRDIHQTGRLLRRKYLLLRGAYVCLAFGVLVSAITTLCLLCFA